MKSTNSFRIVVEGAIAFFHDRKGYGFAEFGDGPRTTDGERR